MAAWPHTRSWSPGLIREYRKYVQIQAPLLKGRLEDCADLSMLLIVNFAAQRGLPLTFADNDIWVYKSSGSGGSLFNPEIARTRGFMRAGSVPVWKTKDEYYSAIKQKIGANALWRNNTEKNPAGPEPGDLLLGRGHAGLIFAVYLPNLSERWGDLAIPRPHPRACDSSIIVYPGPTIAKTQIDVLEYFRDDEGPKGPVKAGTRFDYLNHRGQGKERAELIYYANVYDSDFDPYEFRMFTASVFQD